MATLRVVGLVEDVDMGLQFGDVLGEGLFIQPFEQGRMEPLVLPLRGGHVRFSGDGGDFQAVGVSDQFAGHTPANRIQRVTIVAEQPLRHAVGGDPGAEDLHRVSPALRPGGQ